MDIKLETYYSPSLLPSKVKTIIIDEVSREYQSIFYIKDKGVIKERFEDHFLIDWIIEDAYTNVLKRYFDNYKNQIISQRVHLHHLKKKRLLRIGMIFSMVLSNLIRKIMKSMKEKTNTKG